MIAHSSVPSITPARLYWVPNISPIARTCTKLIVIGHIENRQMNMPYLRFRYVRHDLKNSPGYRVYLTQHNLEILDINRFRVSWT